MCLRKPELDRLGIEFRMTLAEKLPLVRANTDQLRQVLIQVLNNAVEAVQHSRSLEDRLIRVELTSAREHVQILITDSGPGFPNPSRVFDPFFTTKPPGEGPGLGLSICYAIVREHGGEITAYNLPPRGAAVLIEMPLTSLAPLRSPAGEAFVH